MKHSEKSEVHTSAIQIQIYTNIQMYIYTNRVIVENKINIDHLESQQIFHLIWAELLKMI